MTNDTVLLMRLPSSLKDKLKKEARKSKMNVSDYIRKLIIQSTEKKGGKK